MTDWDGHTLALYIADQGISADVNCPHLGEDLTAVSFNKLPRCRTEPREPGTPWPDCSVMRGWQDIGHDAIEGGSPFAISALPVRIGWRWDSEDGLYIWPLPTEDNPGRPTIVVLCGSTRFHAEFARQNLRLTLAGRIVLSIGCDTKSDGDLADLAEYADIAEVKAALDTLHLRKIDLADEVLVLNVGGYVGESTAREIAYAERVGRPIRYLESPAVTP